MTDGPSSVLSTSIWVGQRSRFGQVKAIKPRRSCTCPRLPSPAADPTGAGMWRWRDPSPKHSLPTAEQATAPHYPNHQWPPQKTRGVTDAGGGGGNRTRVLRRFDGSSPGAVCGVSTRPHQSCTQAGVTGPVAVSCPARPRDRDEQ